MRSVHFSWMGALVLLLQASGCSPSGGGDLAGGTGGSGSPGDGSVGAGPGAGGNSTGGGSNGGTGGEGGTPTCVPGVPGTLQTPRLLNAQYDRTVRDLLGLEGLDEANGAGPSALLAPDTTGPITDLAWSSYQTVAAAIAKQTMADPELRANFIPCDPAADEAACLEQTITTFGPRAFRRPLVDADLKRLRALVDARAEITETNSFDEVAELLLRVFLISPSFLTRAELDEQPAGTGYQLSGYETASRLSYLLWGSMPDTALFDAAEAGSLATKAGVLEQATRMLADPKAHGAVAAFHRAYVEMHPNSRWDATNRHRDDQGQEIYPAYTDDLVLDLAAETEAFFDSVTFSGGRFQDLFLSNTAFVNDKLAPLYGLTAQGSALTAVELDGSRPGFLTRAGFLNAYTHASTTAPILRGAFIAKRILGLTPGNPPANAGSTPLPPPTAELNTMRKLTDSMTEGVACKNCHHNYINPPGFALEAFDAIGLPQTTDSVSGSPVAIDTAVDLFLDLETSGATPVHVTGPQELMAALAGAPTAQRRYADLWVQYAYERPPNAEDACVVDELAAKIGGGNYSIQQLILDLTQTDSFRTRTVEVTP